MRDIIPDITEILLQCELITKFIHSWDLRVEMHDSQRGVGQVLHHNAQSRLIKIDLIICLYH